MKFVQVRTLYVIDATTANGRDGIYSGAGDHILAWSVRPGENVLATRTVWAGFEGDAVPQLQSMRLTRDEIVGDDFTRLTARLIHEDGPADALEAHLKNEFFAPYQFTNHTQCQCEIGSALEGDGGDVSAERPAGLIGVHS